MAGSDYPLQFSVDYPEEPVRLTTLFRLILSIPIIIVSSLLTGSQTGFQVFAPLAMIVFRQKYPRWWFDWNLNLMRFETRIFAYAMLLQHEYPSTDQDQTVHIDLEYPDAERDLVRWMPLVKWLLAIPHYVVFLFLIIGALVAAVIAWFAILFTGRMPRGLFNYIVGVMRYGARVQVYAFVLATDVYPPFSIKE